MTRLARLAPVLGMCLALSPTAADEQAPPPAVPAPRAVFEGHFATSLVCARCHSSAPNAQALRDAGGRSVAPFDLWRATTKANSARDPLWRAVVAAEMAATPSKAAEIQAECLRCHSPMASIAAEKAGEGHVSLDLLLDDGPRGQLALDGVSCTVCHQIPPDALGNESGHLGIGDEKVVYGPHPEPFAMPMRRMTGYTPTFAPHLRRSLLCATCHTLRTETLAPDGEPTGHRLLEQATYLEWKNSVFDDERAEPAAEAASCQACHVPMLDADGALIETRLARNPRGRDFPRVQPRAPFGRHLFVGGNALVPAILRDRGAELGALAPREAFEAVIAETRAQLAQRTARVQVLEAARAGDRVLVTVKAENLAGHKLPTGSPELRRAWLRVRVRDAAGALVAASGEHDDQGRIVGAGGAPLPSERAGGPLEPHRDRVSSPDEVALFEAVLADANGRPTWRLLRGAGFVKDDRLLPRGWRPDHPDAAATAPVGLDGDGDFLAGEDTVRYDLPAASGPLAVEVDLLYQPLAARFAAELFALDAPEIARLRDLLAALPAEDRAPVVMASARVDLP